MISISFLRVMTGKGRSYDGWGYEDKSYGKSTGKGWGKSSYEDSWGGGALEAASYGGLRADFRPGKAKMARV